MRNRGLVTKLHRYLRKFHVNVIITGSLILLLCYVWVSIFEGTNCGILWLPSEHPNMDFIERVNKDENEDSNNYWVIRDFLVSNRTDQSHHPPKDEVTIVTQTTVSNMQFLEVLSEAWDGPISVAVFIRQGEAEDAVKRMFTYHHHNMRIRASTTFHLVMRKSVPSINNQDHEAVAGIRNEEADEATYPINLLRNVALSSVLHGYVFLIDIAMVPSPDLHGMFLLHLKDLDFKQKITTAFVVPAFEAESDQFVPTSKEELLQRLKNTHLRLYDQTTCKLCQADTDYERWFSENTTKSYAVLRTSSTYQPFYILDSKMYPNFDERFKKCCKSRMSQVCEVYMSGVDFVVLTEHFVTHRGFRMAKEVGCSGHENKLYEDFQKERIEKYRRTNQGRRC